AAAPSARAAAMLVFPVPPLPVTITSRRCSSALAAGLTFAPFRLKRATGNSEIFSVVVTCERCETEFQLDDARVPSGGARVRCSRCKHAFFVMPPAAAPEEAVHQIAGLALAD